MDRLSNRLNDSKEEVGGLAQLLPQILTLKPQEPLPTTNQKTTQNKTFSTHLLKSM
jgi:hypothetical protein